MDKPIDLSSERTRRQVRKAWDNAVMINVPADQMPPPVPVAAPGYTVVVLDPRGEEVFRMPCQTGDDRMVLGVMPGQAERSIVTAALREAVAGFEPPDLLQGPIEVVVRDCAVCGCEPEPVPDCPCCGGAGGFTKSYFV